MDHDDHDDMEDEILDEEFDTVTMTDEDGLDVEFVIIDKGSLDGVNYLLVVESAYMDDDEPEAIILKEVGDEEDSLTYELVEDGEEFDKVADLFEESGEDYDLEPMD